MREGIQTEFKYNKKTGDEKVHFWLPKALGVGEPKSSPQTHATLLKKKEK
jgi:hypothetical protein